MKRRIVKKQCKKVVGYMTANGLKVVNVVSNPDYLGGTCVEKDEDCYRFEITYTRKRYGAPLHVRARHEEVFLDIYNKVHNQEN
jgi:hypothetical protein